MDIHKEIADYEALEVEYHELGRKKRNMWGEIYRELKNTYKCVIQFAGNTLDNTTDIVKFGNMVYSNNFWLSVSECLARNNAKLMSAKDGPHIESISTGSFIQITSYAYEYDYDGIIYEDDYDCVIYVGKPGFATIISGKQLKILIEHLDRDKLFQMLVANKDSYELAKVLLEPNGEV